MASTYVNDLRLNELATGDGAGTWGTTTNTNLELIGEAFSFGTEAITTNADTHTTTIADGASDPGRSMYLKYTGTLDSACTITIGPNTVSKMWFIENATSGSQNIIISQGSGANITIPAGDVKVIYSDGAGSGAAVVDAFASLNVVDLKVQDDLTVTDDLIVNGDIDLEGNMDVNGSLETDALSLNGTTVTSTAAELNILDGVTSTAAEINLLDGSSANTVVNSKAVIYGSSGEVAGTLSTAAQTNITSVGTLTGLNVSGNGIITTSDNSDTLKLISTDADANQGPVLNLFRNSGSPADSDVLGQVIFAGENDNDEEIDYARLQGFTVDVSDGTESGGLNLQAIKAGTIRSRLKVNSTELAINDDAQNLDFRVESNNDTHQIFVDAANDKVGIGTGSPVELQHNFFDTNNSSSLLTAGTSANICGGFKIENNNSTAGSFAGIGFRSDSADGKIVLATDGTTNEGTFYVLLDDGGGDLKKRLVITKHETVLNDDSENQDFRVESNGSTHMLFVDGGNDRVGIGTSYNANYDASLQVVANNTHNFDDFTSNLVLLDDAGAQGGSGGHLLFAGNDGSSSRGFCKIVGGKANSTSGNYAGQLAFKVRANGEGTLREAFRINTSESVFNETSQDADFRVESNGNANMLFVDGGNDKVSIGGASTDNFEFHVQGTSGNGDNTRFTYTNADANGCTLSIQKVTSSPADNDIIGILQFDSENDADQAVTYAQIRSLMTDVSDGSEDGILSFHTRGAGSFSEKVRIDSSGRLIVGNTSAFDSSSFCVDQSGLGQFRRDGTPLIIRRDGSDGGLIDFEKDGGSVGSIGAGSSDLNINGPAGHSGIRFQASSILPRLDGVDTDGTTDLGYDDGTDTHRWRNLYLSGGAFIGGTGAANKLDDYEEGTWTPVYKDSSGNAITNLVNQQGSYTKVGSLVYIQGCLRTQSSSSTSGVSGNLTITGLPFTSANVLSTGHVVFHTHETSSSYNAPSELPRASSVGANTTNINLYKYSGSGGRTTLYQVSDLNMSGNSNFIFFAGTYRTD